MSIKITDSRDSVEYIKTKKLLYEVDYYGLEEGRGTKKDWRTEWFIVTIDLEVFTKLQNEIDIKYKDDPFPPPVKHYYFRKIILPDLMKLRNETWKNIKLYCRPFKMVS